MFKLNASTRLVQASLQSEARTVLTHIQDILGAPTGKIGAQEWMWKADNQENEVTAVTFELRADSMSMVVSGRGFDISGTGSTAQALFKDYDKNLQQAAHRKSFDYETGKYLGYFSK